MNPLRVWAPRAGRVAAQLAGGRRSMRPIEGGWWELDEDVPPEAEYAFVLDDGEPLPDPRAPRLPHGVAGPARRVDFSKFEWNDAGWLAPPLAAAVLYEMHIGTFSARGTFDAAIPRLDSLVELGITHLSLMPVHSFPGERGWGYDGVGLFAPHEPYGGPEGLARLVDAAHARGLAVLLDVVYNHLGPSGNVLPRFGPYFTDRHRTPWGDAVNLDGPESDEVRRFLCDNALQWLRDYHVDGLRVDAIHALFDQSARTLLEQLREEVDALGVATRRRRLLIAESDLNDPRVVSLPELGGCGFDAQWSDDYHHALHAVLTGERHGIYADFGRLADVAKSLGAGFVYDGRHSVYRRRRHGRPAAGVHGHRFIGYLQSHDQIGNRVRGERSSGLMSVRRLKIGAALVLLAPFVPMLFQGEEWGASTPFLYFTSHADTELGRAIAAGRRRELGLAGDVAGLADPQHVTTFERSCLDWGEARREPHATLRDWHRRLIALRRACPELRDGRLERVQVRFDEAQQWLVMGRGWLRILCHLGSQRCALPLEEAPRVELLLGSDPRIAIGAGSVVMPPDSVAVLDATPSEEPWWNS